MPDSAWRIRGYDSQELIFEYEMPGNMTEYEVCKLLERLVSRHLTDEEIASASLPRSDHRYRPLLERVGTGEPISYGLGVNYSAKRVGK